MQLVHKAHPALKVLLGLKADKVFKELLEHLVSLVLRVLKEPLVLRVVKELRVRKALPAYRVYLGRQALKEPRGFKAL